MEEQKDKGICPRFPRLVIDQARIHLIIKSSYLILHSLGSSLWCTPVGWSFISAEISVSPKGSFCKAMKGIFSSTPQSHSWSLTKPHKSIFQPEIYLHFFPAHLLRTQDPRSKGSGASGDNSQYFWPSLNKQIWGFHRLQRRKLGGPRPGKVWHTLRPKPELMINEKRLFKQNKCKWEKKPPFREVILASGYINVFILLFPILVCCSSMKADLFEMLLLETP